MDVGMMMVFASYGWEDCSDQRVWDEEIRLARLAADLDAAAGRLFVLDPAAIGRDLLDGYVSAAAATNDYGIADPEALRKKAAASEETA